MDKFVEAMLKSASERKKPEPHQSKVDPKEIERITKDINARISKGRL